MEFPLVEKLDKTKEKQLVNLRDFIRNLGRVFIAYSGGVDSTLVAAISFEQLGSEAIAVTGVSPALAPYLLNEARQQANWIGINHQECLTQELLDPNYNSNPVDRCYACKKELHKHLKAISELSAGAKVLDGVNHDDLSEDRPGIEAAKMAGVISPLAELKIPKNTVRVLSKGLGFPWWDKPAQPCLASRFPYGEAISSKRLKQIALAEKWLISRGFIKVRVRLHGLSARIEIPKECIDDFLKSSVREDVVKYFISIGFTSVSLDLEGLVSGKLNRDKNN
ncbi:ATP-dependent sacrificial sulfur transferase LarE [Prochlorococcus sp. MIT 1223]|uniref:ATP-dependent sacrificial sulfur transferase LarE n=1 Tax=Prochlorococcus sp. MIT 1223 TaxID=3096217 RepID=UPI002A759631|nr:ATP-dependent sacrificial sulfur transferase LarE [Prochlorococcus sp. MIT 1223]